MAGYADIEPPPISPQQWSAEHDGQEAPMEVLRPWRKWADRENAWIEKSAEQMGGMSTDEQLLAMGYQDEPDKGKSVFSRFRAGDRAGSLETIGKDAFKTAVNRGHFTYDQKTGMYYNIGQGDPNDPRTWQWVKEGGAPAAPPMGGSKTGYGSGWGYGGRVRGEGGSTPQGPTYGYGGGGGGGGGGTQNPWMQAVQGSMPGGAEKPPQGYLPFVPGYRQAPTLLQQQQEGARGRQMNYEAEEMDRNSPYKQLLPRGTKKQPDLGAF